MKNLSSLFIALAVFCFVAFSSCQGSGSAEAETTHEEEMVEEVATEVVDSAAVEADSVTVEAEAEESSDDQGSH